MILPGLELRVHSLSSSNNLSAEPYPEKSMTEAMSMVKFSYLVVSSVLLSPFERGKKNEKGKYLGLPHTGHDGNGLVSF